MATNGSARMPMPTWRDQWNPGVAYNELDFFVAPDGGLGAVMIPHTSAATFDWGALDTGGTGLPVYRQLIGGSGTNTANGSAVAVQVGSGNAANGSTAALQIQPSTAGVRIKADAGPLAPALKTNVSISANEVLGRTLGIDLSGLGASPGPATVFILDIVHVLVPGVSDQVGLQRAAPGVEIFAHVSGPIANPLAIEP